MEELVLSIISLIILIPIIYFLPLGLSNKGKGILIIIALVFANAGLLANSNFPIWQTGLILLVLCILAVYVLDKRFKNFLFANSNDDTQFEPSLEEETKGKSEAVISEQIFANNDAKGDIGEYSLNETNEGNDISPISTDEQPEIEELPISRHEPELEGIAGTLLQETEELSEIDTFQNEGDVDHESDEETAFLTSRETAMDEEELLSEKDNVQELNYMSEIELLLENDHLEDYQENKDNDIGENHVNNDPESYELKFSINAEENSNGASIEEQDEELEVFNFEHMDDATQESDEQDESPLEMVEDELEPTEIEEQDTEMLELELLKEDVLSQIDEAQSEVAASIVLDSIANNGSITGDSDESDSLDEITELAYEDSSEVEKEDELIAEDYSMEEELETKEDEELDVSAIDSTIQEVTDESAVEVEPIIQKTVLQQRLFHTMVSQIQFARKQMSANSYEAYIKEYLHPDLPVQEYYTFASLLIEHYISRKELGKLNELLTILSDKFTNYPILDMEIQYLFKQYCEKTR
ncbi:hypothetical protein [Robertmurraya kyonggiensis]|uniref:Uncharacterized protein n=1 Tax=Robertmurraya kyonggiensis TaxID=1037680 RepID=A0A4U1D1G3_9BACI|nr:hypothetical protein [Robertmurraya kyonggiensis]TKC15628.1 hypothetical protein FA727_15990 [Robertmurraya kyonggiensis]